MNYVLIYARASSDPDDKRISVDRQLKLCAKRAHELWPGAEVKTFRDDDLSAADPNVARPGYEAFVGELRSARKGEIVGIVVNEQSRLTRQGTGAWDDLVVTLSKAGITKVETLSAGTISVEPGNRLTGRLLAVIDAEEVERTKARVQAAHRELFSEGRPSGRAPYGYRSVRDEAGRPNYQPDPAEAKVVKRVFKMALQGHALNTIAARLNDDGVPPPSAGWNFKKLPRQVTRWRAPSVRVVLTSASVAGLRGHTDENAKLHTVPGSWPALVDEGEWRQVQRLLGQPTVVRGANGTTYRVRATRPSRARRYLLSGSRSVSGEVTGVLRCSKCASPLGAQTQQRASGKRVGAYACHPKLDEGGCGGISISPTDEVDKLVVAAVKRRLASSPKLRRRLEVAQDAEAATWRGERDAAKARMLQAAELFGSGAIDRDVFDAMHNPAKAAFEHAEQKLSALTVDTTLPSVEDVQLRWDSLTLKQQRAVIERLIGSIVVAPARGGRRGFDVERLSEPEWLA
jgi:DNA invertase Pin-like site-specific DNA recombinase